MKALPKRYAWLAREPAPRLLRCALELHGVVEVPGPHHNPIILNWAEELGLDDVYGDDAIPWCGLFMAIVAKRAGYPVVTNPLWARSWITFERAKASAELGDVLVFSRDGGGHVGVYVAEDARAYHVLGGNQSDAVTITRILKSRCIAIREPFWRIGKPPNVRRVVMNAAGPISINEA